MAIVIRRGWRFVAPGSSEPDPEEATASFEDTSADDTTGTSFTLPYADVSGASGAQRLVAVAVIADSGSAPTLTVMIDDEAAELVGTAGSQSAAGATNYIAFFLAPGTAATTFDVGVSSSASCFCCYSALWTIDGVDTVLDSASDGNNDGSPLSLNLDTQTGGLAFGAALGYQGATNPTAAWAGLTEDADSVHVFTDEDFTAASLVVESGSTPLTVSVTWDGMNGSTQAQAGAAISFEAPAGSPGGGGGDIGDLELLSWEGGSAYYAQFPKAAAAGWDEDTFFPFGVFLSPGQDPHAENLAAIGVTHYMSIEANAGNITNALADGMAVWPQMAEWSQAEVTSEAGNDVQCMCWFVDDEPDMNEAYGDQFDRLAEVEGRVSLATSYADGRFTALNIGNGVNKTFWSPDTVEDMVRAVDVSGVDQYCYSSENVRFNVISSGDWPLAGESHTEARCAAAYGWLADQMRSFQDPHDRKPFFVTVETAKPLIAEDDPWITVPEIEGAVWAAICHEARGIMFFQHNNNGDFEGTDPFYSLSDSDSTTIRSGVQAIITKVNSLAPVLNTQTNVFNFGATGIHTMLKIHGGFVYIFAHVALGGSTGTKTFTLPTGIAGTTAEVVGESRSINVTDGEFSDDFDEEYTHHVYKISVA